MRRASLLSLSLCVLACSNGPKGSPGGTIESYYDAANDKDWPTMVGMLAPETLKRIGSPAKMAKYLETSFENWDEFDVEIDDVRVNNDGKTGTVQFTCRAQVFNLRDRKNHPGTCNDLWSVVKQDDGNWYIVLPESQRLKPML